MAFRVRLPDRKLMAGKKLGWGALLLRGLLVGAAAVMLVVLAVFGYYYYRYTGIVDERLKQPLFATTAKIYAAPREVRPGQKLTISAIVNELREAGYTADGGSKASPLGTYSTSGETVSIKPGPQSYHSQDGATIQFEDGVVHAISDDRGQALASYELEPLLITGLSEDANRGKRRVVTYDQLPRNLVQAVVAIEDRRFFEHSGVDYWRLLGALRNDLMRKHNYMEGGSTLTMQAARGFFLTPEKKIKRKMIEIVITFQLEHRFTKEQIFQMYGNQINLGQQGSFAINGFGEAAQAYFGKDVKQLDLAQCAMLAGMIQHPSYLNPYHHPERVLARRNLVLDSMVETGAITKDQAESAKAEGLHLSVQSVDASEAPYFVDLVRDQLNQKLGERDFNREGLHIYTSLDPDLQKAATSAVESTIHIVDELVDKQYAKHHKGEGGAPSTYPQVALVALNPHTGQVLALVGGRNYGASQLNHAVAKRPTGSIFKPFVYASAFNTAVAGADTVLTPASMVDDSPTTFTYGDQIYEPRNYKEEYHGPVTARYALAMSLNNATVKLAEQVGYDKVAQLARAAGIKSVQ